VRGGGEPNYLVLDFVATVSCHSFGFGNDVWQLLALEVARLATIGIGYDKVDDHYQI